MRARIAVLIFCALARAESIKLETPTGVLYGTLELPAGSGPFPVAILHAGSGPVDRDGNSPANRGNNNSLRMLAEGLAARGIAAVRFDKRGTGESAKAQATKEDVRLDAYIDDLIAWGKQMRADKRFHGVILIGHSEGALIAAVAAQKLPADAFVSLAGAGKPLDQVILEQLSDRAPPEIKQRCAEIVASLRQGKTVEAVPPALLALFRPSTQPYLISAFRYDPAMVFAKLQAPALILQGTTDIQASPADANLLAAAKPSAKLVLVEGMNHVLKMVPSDLGSQAVSYGNPTLPLAPQVVPEIVKFVAGLPKK